MTYTTGKFLGQRFKTKFVVDLENDLGCLSQTGNFDDSTL